MVTQLDGASDDIDEHRFSDPEGFKDDVSDYG